MKAKPMPETATSPSPQSFRERLRPWLSRFILVILFVPFMEWKGECYPFSHFPMYSNLGDIWTLKLTDENDQYLSVQRQFSGKPNSIRKLNHGRLRQVQAERKISNVKDLGPAEWEEAGRRTLTWLLENHKPMGDAAKVKSLKLWREEYHLAKQGGIEKRRILVIDFPMPAQP
jgi:hypothetical protein